MFALWDKIKSLKGTKIIAVVTVIVCVLSGALTMGREAVADDYEIYSKYHVDLSRWIEENTDTEDVFLTNDRYNNAITSLTGRNIVCGSNSFFATHGLPGYKEMQRDIKKMYANPTKYISYFEKYNVDYMIVGSDEYRSYEVDEEEIASLFPLVYCNGDISVYKVS